MKAKNRGRNESGEKHGNTSGRSHRQGGQLRGRSGNTQIKLTVTGILQSKV